MRADVTCRAVASSAWCPRALPLKLVRSPVRVVQPRSFGTGPSRPTSRLAAMSVQNPPVNNGGRVWVAQQGLPMTSHTLASRSWEGLPNNAHHTPTSSIVERATKEDVKGLLDKIKCFIFDCDGEGVLNLAAAGSRVSCWHA